MNFPKKQFSRALRRKARKNCQNIVRKLLHVAHFVVVAAESMTRGKFSVREFRARLSRALSASRFSADFSRRKNFFAGEGGGLFFANFLGARFFCCGEGGILRGIKKRPGSFESGVFFGAFFDFLNGGGKMSFRLSYFRCVQIKKRPAGLCVN